MRIDRSAFVFLFLSLLTIIASIAFVKSQRSNVLQSSLEPSNTPFSAPILYPSLSWSKTSADDAKSIRNSLKFFLYYDYEPVNFRPDGKEWVSRRSGSTPSVILDIEAKFSSYYNLELKKTNWSESIKYGGKNLMTMFGDGPTGSVWGYLKIVEDKVGIILFSSDTLQGEFRVFVAEPISLSKIK